MYTVIPRSRNVCKSLSEKKNAITCWWQKTIWRVQNSVHFKILKEKISLLLWEKSVVLGFVYELSVSIYSMKMWRIIEIKEESAQEKKKKKSGDINLTVSWREAFPKCPAAIQDPHAQSSAPSCNTKQCKEKEKKKNHNGTLTTAESKRENTSLFFICSIIVTTICIKSRTFYSYKLPCQLSLTGMLL